MCPPHLTSLTIPFIKQTSVDEILALPRTITSLDMAECFWLNGKHLEAFPPKLTHLNIRKAILVSAEDIEKLPHSLTSLTYSNEEAGGALCLNLPPNLLELELCQNSFSQRRVPVSVEYLTKLPPSLHTLTFKCPWNCEREHAIAFPSGLKILRGDMSISVDSMALLPPNLSELDLNSKGTPSEVLFAGIPRQVKILKVSVAIRNFNPEDLKLLPESLHTLKLDNPGFTKMKLEDLPRGLRCISASPHWNMADRLKVLLDALPEDQTIFEVVPILLFEQPEPL